MSEGEQKGSTSKYNTDGCGTESSSLRTTGSMPGVQIFSDKSFFVLQRVPFRTTLIQDIEHHGGRVVKLEIHADYVIADHLRKDAPAGSLSYTFIEDAIKAGEIPDRSKHLASTSASTALTSTSRPIASGSTFSRPVKSTRTPFTAEDDITLWRWVKHCEAQGARILGLEIYKQLEEMNPRHTFQSWRDRYVKVLQHRPPPTVIADGPPTPPSEPMIQDSASGASSPELGSSPVMPAHRVESLPRDSSEVRFSPDKETSRNMTDTQAILDADTQALDFDIPELPEISDSVSMREESSAALRRQSDYFRHDSRPVSPIPSDGEDVNVYIEAKIQLGFNEDDVIDALEATSMQTKLAEVALDALSNGRGLPKGLSGIWTRQDDEDLESSDSSKIQWLERKHGSREVTRRLGFLNEMRG
ncbi:hypothetical protein K461DRAFT_231335 [Myriangium duriaei CBS 260.36]|uniref:DNA-binding protein RAP1 n=1 Tax=Myriangium duriaei CBS 260.36 TaxID=1168546 RepID=A0A9P4IVP1_9PEZI|nr:hypothetical protein K461DRAFT_231335 [Myriangium duriaei CBS 260.36]